MADLDFDELDVAAPNARKVDWTNTNIPENEGVRRLPLYLLIDRSESMDGAPIEAVRRGLNALKSEIAAMPDVRDTIYIGLIIFSDNAELSQGQLVSVSEFEVPPLLQRPARGLTNLGAACRILNESIDRDVHEVVTGKAKGDWKPQVFLLTDGKPDPGWEAPLWAVLGRKNRKLASFVAVGCGDKIDVNTLKQIAGPNGKYAKMGTSDFAFQAFFAWVTQSAVSMFATVHGQGLPQEDASIPTPDDKVIQYVDPDLSAG